MLIDYIEFLYKTSENKESAIESAKKALKNCKKLRAAISSTFCLLVVVYIVCVIFYK